MTETWDRASPPPLALDLIAKVEAFRAAAYQDGTGVWTVGFGSTVMPGGRRVVRGDMLEQADARLLLGRQAQAWCAAIARHVSSSLSTNEAAALISWVHNLGEGNLCGSTLAAMLDAGRHDLAQRQFGSWVMAGGQKSLGLMRRRELERRIFAGGTLAEYDGVWRLGEAAFEPAYAQAFADAAAWRGRTAPATVIAESRPGPTPTPVLGQAGPTRATSAATDGTADALNDAELARMRG